MKNETFKLSLIPLFLLGLCGCQPVGAKSASLTVIYGATAVLSLVLLVVCICTVRKSNPWLVTLFASVFVVNSGYFFLAVSSSLSEALTANRLSYLGSVFLPLSMFLIILKATNTPYRRFLPWVLGGISVLVFLVAASPGILDIYYKEVSFAVINGVSTLVKEYGPLHPLYLFFLLSYFAVMGGTIVRALIKKTLDTPAHAVIILIAVFVNLAVWFVEQLANIDFEILSISYIISEMFLLGLHLMIRENRRLQEIIEQQAASASKLADEPQERIGAEEIALFEKGIALLTPKERAVFEAYVAGNATKDILVALNIKENTLKFHSKNLYSKLGVGSRKQLETMYKHLKVSDTNDSK